LSGEIGRCAVVETSDLSSICEIINVRREIEPGDLVKAKKLSYPNKTMYPLLFGVLEKVVEPYEPNKQITVYVHDVYDEKENVTPFSERIKAEMKNLFSQKARIRVVNDVDGVYSFYPSEYKTWLPQIKTYLKRDKVDVLLSGRYQVSGSTVEVSVYVIDKNWGDIRVLLPVPAGSYIEDLSKVTIPYTPIARRSDVSCTFQYRPARYMPLKDEKKDIVLREADNNPFVEYNFGKLDFNIISPVDVKLTIDNDLVDLVEKGEHRMSLSGGGIHRLSVSFRKGYYYNEALMYTSQNEVKKDAYLTVDKEDGAVEVIVAVNAAPGKEGVDLMVHKKTTRLRQVLKPILKMESEILTETFKD
jgi:hypothetical protein